MSKAKYSIHERIAVRAYYLWLDSPGYGADKDWIEAEEHETYLLHARRSAARKGAATKRNQQRLRELMRTNPMRVVG